jgi:protein gp37
VVDPTWRQVLTWNAAARAAGERRRVLVSMCDPFDNAVDPAWRSDFWCLIRNTQCLDWLLWTKRIGNVPDMLPPDWGDGWANVILGISIVNQAEADRDIPKLLAVPAARRVLSIEPMLALIDLRGRLTHCPTHDFSAGFCLGACPDRRSISWVICGGESGRGCRPMELGWAYSLRDQCAAAGIPFYMKQMGGERPGVMPPIPADLLVQEYPA